MRNLEETLFPFSHSVGKAVSGLKLSIVPVVENPGFSMRLRLPITVCHLGNCCCCWKLSMCLNALMNSYWSASVSLLLSLSIDDTYAPLQAYPCSNFLNENGNWKEHFCKKKKMTHKCSSLCPPPSSPTIHYSQSKGRISFQSDLTKKGLSLRKKHFWC